MWVNEKAPYEIAQVGCWSGGRTLSAKYSHLRGLDLAVRGERPHLSSPGSALCNQFLLFSFTSVSVVLRSELASDSFGKNLLETVSLL